ncbi:dicarboxylate/amino acid:cation symporter [Polymorphobacter sp.]|uniref:dicarboxylate/amino acid:cation symporter n=1 Tax=Polymorphobacter sp. TaxID=1909290 RepID=UPI003F706344
MTGSTSPSLIRRWFDTPLWQRILGALVLGALAGWLAGDQVSSIRWIGDLFIRMIRMLIVPLVFVTLVAGVTAMKDPARIASIGIKAMTLYMGTTLAAIVIGMGLAVILQPGSGIDLSGVEGRPVEAAMPLAARMMAIVPDNVFAAFAEADILAIIFFGVLLGAGMLLAGEAAAPLTRLFSAGAEVMLKVTGIVMEFAPIGVFALVAWVMGTEGPGAFVTIFKLSLVVYLGGALHMLLTHASIVRLVGKMKPGRFFTGVRTPQLLAFSTSSSAATLPATLEAAEKRLGVSPPIASSVLPLGATVNMDGTALYVAAVAVFAAQIFGMPLTLTDYLLIALTTTLVSIGTASVPSASLFLMAAVLEAIGIAPAQIALVIGFVLPFDRILDMWRTVVNVTGDLAVATAVSRWEGDPLPD